MAPSILEVTSAGGRRLSCQWCPCTQICPLREALCEGTCPWSLLPGLYVFSSRSGVPSPWNRRQVCGSAEDRQGPDIHSEEDLCWGSGRGGAGLI